MSQWIDCPITGQRPSVRGGHASVLLPMPSTTEEATPSSRMGLVIIGGSDAFGMAYNDVFIMETNASRDASEVSACTNCEDASKLHCTVLQSTSSSVCPFSPRMGHSAHAVPTELATKMAHVTSQFPSASGVTEINDDAETAVAAANTKKAPRLSNPIIVFGGMSVAPEALHNSVWLLRVDVDYKKRIEDDNTKKVRTSSTPLVFWEEFKGCTGVAPPPRHAHAGAVVGDELIIVGGSNGNHPLEDGYALHLVTRVWRKLDLLATPWRGNGAGSSTPFAATSAILAREMASMAVHPLTGQVLLAGGRDEEGLMIGDAYTMDINNNALECVMRDDNQRRCCHTLVPSIDSKFGPIFVAVGGFTPSGMPLEDVIIVTPFTATTSPKVITVPRKLQRKPSDELHFGLGHSACSARSGIDSLCVYAVMGIMPNAVGATMGVYKLLVGDAVAHTSAGEEPLAKAKKPADATISGLL